MKPTNNDFQADGLKSRTAANNLYADSARAKCRKRIKRIKGFSPLDADICIAKGRPLKLNLKR